MDDWIKPFTSSSFITARLCCCPSVPNGTIPVNNWAVLTIVLFTWCPSPLCRQGHEDDICKIWSWPFLIHNAVLVLSQGLLPSATGVPPPHPPLLGVLLSCSTPVDPHHRHNCLLPKWLVSLSIKLRGYCCPPLLGKIKPCAYQQIHFILLVSFGKKNKMLLLQTLYFLFEYFSEKKCGWMHSN